MKGATDDRSVIRLTCSSSPYDVEMVFGTALIGSDWM